MMSSIHSRCALFVALAAPVVASAAPITTILPPPTVELLDAGVEPRRLLRIEPHAGDEQVIVVTADISMEATIDGEAQPATPIPTVKQVMAIRVDNVRLDGEMALSIAFIDISLPEGAGIDDPLVRDAVDQIIESLKKVTITMNMTPRGVIKSHTIELPDDLMPEVGQMMKTFMQSFDQANSPFPEEPVGVGARWSVTRDVDMGVPIPITGSYEVVSIDGDTITVRSTIKGDLPDNKPAQVPDMPEGDDITIESLHATGAGSIVQNLHSVTPRSASVTVTSVTEMKMAFQGEEATTSNTITKMKVSIQEEPPAPDAPRR